MCTQSLSQWSLWLVYATTVATVTCDVGTCAVTLVCVRWPNKLRTVSDSVWQWPVPVTPSSAECATLLTEV